MIADYHIHTKRCGHASGEMEEYIEAARNKGLKEIGFSDHVYVYWLPKEERDLSIAMAEEELPEYINDVFRLKEKSSDIIIRLGFEADYIPGHTGTLKKIITKYPFDYVYGSIHFLDGWAFDNSRYSEGYKDWSPRKLYEYYFKTVQNSAKSGLFDILGHPDLIKKFDYRLEKPPLDLYEETARIIGEAGVGIEINAAGLRYPAKELYPAEEFLIRCHHYGVPVSLGSDAHKPEQVGSSFDQCLELARRVGYKQIAVYEQRRRKLVPLP